MLRSSRRSGLAAAVAVVAAAAAMGACSNTPVNEVGAGGGGGGEHAVLVVNGGASPVCLAIARSQAEQEAGLANKATLPAHEGMAFPDPARYLPNGNSVAVWMKDTQFPLVAVWVGEAGKIVGTTDLTPLDTTLHQAPGPITMMIELSPADWRALGGNVQSLGLGGTCRATTNAVTPRATTHFS